MKLIVTLAALLVLVLIAVSVYAVADVMDGRWIEEGK